MKPFVSTILVVLILAGTSIFIGVSPMSLSQIFRLDSEGNTATVLLASRLPRTFALMLAGTGLAVAGTIMQMLARNRFAEPSTVGTADAAALGMLITLIVAPAMPVVGKMLVAGLFAMAGTGLFLALLSQIPLRSQLMVPLVGIMFGGVINAATAFLAYRFDLMQSLGAWATGDFSAVLRGRYELLWIALSLTVVAYFAAARLTLAGLGEEVARNLGLDYRMVLTLGIVIVALVTASVVITVGAIAFVGLVVPNLVSMAMGDNLRRTLPWVAIGGAGLLLACDIVGRLIVFPYEIPVGTVVGVLGSAFFLYLLLTRYRHAG
ncbi:MAG: ABC transporter permease [Rhizobiales bacterium]|nr:ABC transporter permease [Hyphomicrobiales bacterium]